MKRGQSLIFWRKVVQHSREPDKTPHTFELEAVPAYYVRESDPVCGTCGESGKEHFRKRRRHQFEPRDTNGITIDVHYWNEDEGIETRHNVYYGREANHYTVSKE